MTNKYTPGPWVYVGYDNDTGPDDGSFWEWWSVGDAQGETIAEVKSGEDDAHLIAAAPDLYEALEKALLEWGSNTDWRGTARKALAKARGEI